jgi:hypothetical protein
MIRPEGLPQAAPTPRERARMERDSWLAWASALDQLAACFRQLKLLLFDLHPLTLPPQVVERAALPIIPPGRIDIRLDPRKSLGMGNFAILKRQTISDKTIYTRSAQASTPGKFCLAD